jgi:hypothetical protein
MHPIASRSQKKHVFPIGKTNVTSKPPFHEPIKQCQSKSTFLIGSNSFKWRWAINKKKVLQWMYQILADSQIS